MGLSVVLGLLVCAGCTDSPAPVTPTSTDLSWDPGATSLTFEVESSDGSDSPFVLRATDIVWAADSGILTAQVAVQNLAPDTLAGPLDIAVFDFVPDDVVPLNAVCGIVPGPCWYEYADAYGEDGLLAPGEISESREWQILDARGEGFRFRTRLIGTPDPGGRVAGVTYHDVNRNGQRDVDEPGIGGVGVSFKVIDRPAVVLTNEVGHFDLRVEQPGVYTLLAYPTDGLVPTTPTEMQVVVFRRPDGTLSDFLHADFGFARRNAGPGVGGIVWLDDNRDGLRQANEPGVPGVEITVTAFPPDTRALEPCAQQPTVVTTDEAGRWFASNTQVSCTLPWLVQRGAIVGNNPNGLPQPLFGTTPRDWVAYARPGVPGETIQVDFGVAPYGASWNEPALVVEGVVFVDVDGNGVRDPNEPPASGVRLELLSPCDRLESSWANHRGAYRFEPPNTAWCPIGGVAVSSSWQTTTENPILFPPPTTLGVHVIHADFGVLPRDVDFPQ